ncbi:UNVERIFIED_CONTAM: protein SPA1-RELATED 4 [Sesamum radiatum]|uniref:Protein SPA1-RELATED 4 n=1 Tax=Sesamum radiatum TaxID=300843 RepID=A0AAW2K3N9_SESRA
MSSFNRVSFIESASAQDSGSDSQEYGSNSNTAELKGSSSPLPRNSSSHQRSVNQLGVLDCRPGGMLLRKLTLKPVACNHVQVRVCMLWKPLAMNEQEKEAFISNETNIAHGIQLVQQSRRGFWWSYFLCFRYLSTRVFYSSREKHNHGKPETPCPPSTLLLKWPKEASFCLWLLHPEPSSRPKMIKQDAADSLNETISVISSDIEEVSKLQTALRTKGGSSLELGKDSAYDPHSVNEDDDSSSSGSRKRIRHGLDITSQMNLTTMLMNVGNWNLQDIKEAFSPKVLG